MIWASASTASYVDGLDRRPILRLHDVAFGSVKLRCALGSGSSDGGAAGLPGFLRAFSVALLFFFGLDAALFLRGQLGVGLQHRRRLLDLRQPFRLVAGPIRHLVTTLVFAESLVLLGIRRLGGRRSMRATSAFNSNSRFFMR